MDINSVKQAMEKSKSLIDSHLIQHAHPDCAEYEGAIKTLVSVASLVVNAPASNELTCIVSKESLHEPSRRRGWNQAIQADRLLWVQAMLRLPEIIYPLIPKSLGKDEKHQREWICEVLAKEVSINIADSIKDKLGITQPKG